MKLFLITFLFVTCFTVLSLADSHDLTANQFSQEECVKDSDCDCVLAADHCRFLPVNKNKARKKSDHLKLEKEHPVCFGPKTYVIPKCQYSRCLCQDRGKAPD